MNKNSRLGLWVLIPGFVLAFIARMSQICIGTDMELGFLKDDNGFFMDACFWGAVILTFAAAVALAVYDRHSGSALYSQQIAQISGKKAAMIGFALMLPAMGALYEGYCEAVIPAESNISPSPFMMWVNFIFGAAMLVSAFIILYFKEFRPGLGFSLVSGAACYTLRGIGIFMEKMAVTTVPEHLINCMSVILTAVFFMQLTKLLSGNEGKRTREVLTVTGATTAVMILANAAAALASMLFGPAEIAERIVTSSAEAELLYQAHHGVNAYFMSLVPMADAAAGIFIVVTLIALYMKAEPLQEHSAQPGDDDDETAAL